MEETLPGINKKTRNEPAGKGIKIKFDAATFGGQLQNGFKTLYASELLSDVELAFGEDRFKAHKFVLFAWSAKFQLLLSQEPALHEVRIDIKTEQVPLFRLLLEFLYTGNLTLYP